MYITVCKVCLPRGSPVTLCPRARSAERIAGPVACRPECTETYISLPGRLTSGTSESRAKFTTPESARFELGSEGSYRYRYILALGPR